MYFIGIDLEGVLVPEIWQSLAQKTKVKELALTTKDIPNYEDLMNNRIKVLNKNKIRAKLLFDIAKKIKPFEGALTFLDELRQSNQVIVLSDTFYNLSQPIFKKLNFPSVLCHHLVVNKKGMISGMRRCTNEHKRKTISFMNKLNFKTITIGDSYNDINMLREAQYGVLFNSSKEITGKFPNFFSCNSYKVLLKNINEKKEEWSK